MNELVGRWAAQGNTAKHERASMVGEFLLSVVPLLSKHLDGFEALDGLPGDTNSWQD